MPFDSGRYARISGTTAALTTTSRETVAAVPGTVVPVHLEILRVKMVRASGAASATFLPRIYSTSAGTTGTIAQEYSGTSTASTALFDATNIQGHCLTDSTGNLYLQANPDVGSTDTWSYQIDLLINR